MHTDAAAADLCERLSQTRSVSLSAFVFVFRFQSYTRLVSLDQTVVRASPAGPGQAERRSEFLVVVSVTSLIRFVQCAG